MLEQTALKERLRYEPETGHFYWVLPSKFHSEKVGALAGTVTATHSGKAYVNISIDGRKYKRSRLAILFMTGRWPEQQVDHINGNSCDDRWCNLREATPQQNAWNHKKRKKPSTLPMGVRTAASGRFVARISVNKKLLTLGTFDTPHAAYSEYLAARRRFYGQFA